MKKTNLIPAGLRLVAGDMWLSQFQSRAVDFHVTTAQELQNALTLAAANGADDNINGCESIHQ
jgi:hypothetical protein